MNAQLGVVPQPVAGASAPSAPPPGIAVPAQLTRVRLAHVAQRLDVYLRFGDAIRTFRLDRWRRVAVFLPGSVFCRIYWQGNDYGTTRWQLLVLQACTPADQSQRISGVQPGVQLLLRAEGSVAVRAVLLQIDAIAAQGIAASAVSPAYWRTLANRLQARQPLPSYTRQRHAAWQARGALQ